ncbi:uncharacterized protein PV06_10167 [Exophiala oligosperma]|uniref:Uncharacterized protein n=1 Tax=Exophiala oligosperma TaxID=215243 RepID=A0A0D2DP02_9EURO|nr:uncharacterized protein PV06_10167 [Exophiala oligosperma]KIW37514.1 hypothetical protein PV06_10167 [Exophiala oligosperma]
MTVHELIQTVTKFHGELNLLLSELPKDLEIGSLGRSSHSPKQVNKCLYLHFSIHSSIMAAHCHLFYPWLVSRFSGIGSDATVKDQIASSSNIIAEAARKIILALRLVNPSVATPSCLAFYYPLHAMINLFIHLVKSPALSTAATDLGLLDACVGHFGYVEFFTASAVSITLPREVANVASRAVQVARTKNTDSTAVERVTDNTQQNESEAQSAGTEVFNFNFDDFQTEPILQNEEGVDCVFGERRRARLDRTLAENRKVIAELELRNHILVQALRKVISTMPDLLPEQHLGLSDIMTEDFQYDLFRNGSPISNINDPTMTTTVTSHHESPSLPQTEEQVPFTSTAGHGSTRQVGLKSRRSPSVAREKSVSLQKGLVGSNDNRVTTKVAQDGSGTRTSAMAARGGGDTTTPRADNDGDFKAAAAHRRRDPNANVDTNMDTVVGILAVTSIYYVLD